MCGPQIAAWHPYRPRRQQSLDLIGRSTRRIPRILQGVRRKLYDRPHGADSNKKKTMNRISRFTNRRCSQGNTVKSMKPGIARIATTLLVSGGLGMAALGLGAGAAHAYNYGPFQWCPGQDLPNDPPRPDGELVWDMSVCHTYYFAYDIRDPGTPARYWEGPNLFPTPIPPPPPPANPPNIFEQCPGLIPFVNCLPGL
jgi:hypothetical protein